LRRTRSEKKKRQIRAMLRMLAPDALLFCADETDLLLFPPLRAAWSRRGQAAPVPLSGYNQRRVIFGAMNLLTGARLFMSRRGQKSDECH
jgi:hypothetical protein